ncbi:MAG TPA: HdeD family acid-resistance protein [Rhizomicrobium sp.]
MTDTGLPLKAENTFAAHWRMFFFEGVVLVVLGIIALILPPLASIAVAILFGWLLFIGGVFGLITTLMGRHAPGFWWALLSSLVAIVAGVLLFGWPAGGALSLTVILTGFLAADGILTIMLALDYRRALHERWMWLMVNGVIDLILAGLIFVGLPESAAWAIGIIVGVDLLFGGSSLIAMSLASRNRTAR